MTVYDISQEVYSCRVYPGDPCPKKRVLLRISEGAVCNLSEFTMCAHNGTHVDAPYHFLDDGRTIDQLPIETLVGPCFVFCAEGEIGACLAEDFLHRAEAAGAAYARRILIRGAAVVSAEAAEVFAKRGVLLVGNESQTVGPENAPAQVHRILLGAGVVLLEGIRLSHVPEGKYLLSAAPLNLAGSDGSPCRAVLIDPE